MSLTIGYPFHTSYTRTYPNGGVHSDPDYATGVMNDTVYDSRKPLTRTPKGAWRPPTSYWRQVDTGRQYTYDLNGTASYMLSDKSIAEFTHTGARNVSGYYYDPPLAVPARLEAAAITKARLKLKDQDINLAQAFGERAQTARLVSDSLKSITGAVRGLRRGDLQAAQRALGLRQKGDNRIRPEAAFDRWLELQYGWKPLLGDVEGASKRLWGIHRESSRMTARCKAASFDYERISRPFTDVVGNVYVNLIKHREIEYKTFVRLDFVRSENNAVANWSELGITNPLSLAWELLPFSFVFDWFIPVGDYLSSLDATLGWDFIGGSCTTVMREKHRCNVLGVPPIPWTYWSKGSMTAAGKGYKMRMNRKVYDTAPIADVPSLDTGKSFLHVANGIALLGSAFAGSARVR